MYHGAFRPELAALLSRIDLIELLPVGGQTSPCPLLVGDEDLGAIGAKYQGGHCLAMGGRRQNEARWPDLIISLPGNCEDYVNLYKVCTGLFSSIFLRLH